MSAPRKALRELANRSNETIAPVPVTTRDVERDDAVDRLVAQIEQTWRGILTQHAGNAAPR